MRSIHRIGAITTALPVGIILVTGIFLQLKKEWAWVQPPTQQGSGTEIMLDWNDMLLAAQSIPEANVRSWSNIDRIDVRPARGIAKLRCDNRWEIQLDLATGEVLSSTYRRSDVIESIHDGSWFSDSAKLYLWLPSAVFLLILWLTGLYLWVLPRWVLAKRRRVAQKLSW